MSAWLGLILIHEAVISSRHSGACEVLSIELYPIHVIAALRCQGRGSTTVWLLGGVVAQAVVAIPLVAYVLVFGYTRIQPLNAILAILASTVWWSPYSTCFPQAGLTVRWPGR